MSEVESGRSASPERRAVSHPPVPRRTSRAVYWRRRAVLGAGLVIVMGLVIALLTGSPGHPDPSATTVAASSRAQWSHWTRQLEPLLVRFDHDYAATGRDLNGSTNPHARASFTALARDAALLRAAASSHDPTVNADLITLAATVTTIASLGTSEWPSINLTKFTAATRAYLTASRHLTNAILDENANL